MKAASAIFFLLVSFSTISLAQSPKAEIDMDLHRSASNLLAYPAPEHAKETPAPSGYKPFYVSTYARHGSRYLIRPEEYEAPLAALQKASGEGALSPLGEEVLAVADSLSRAARGRYGELTPKGARQHRDIAARMFRRFPEAFEGDALIEARSTPVPRCILSMSNELWTLKGLNPSLRLRADASAEDAGYLNDEFNPVIRYRSQPLARASADTFARARVSPERLILSLYADTAAAGGPVGQRRLMQELFHVASALQNNDIDFDLYKIFTREECYNLWLRDNYGWYVNYGPSPLTEGMLPHTQDRLLRNIIETADTCIASGRNGATLRFGHEVALLPLACLMELDDCAYATADPDSVAFRWRNYRIFPMAANIQLVFYRKKKSDDVLVKALLNEQEARLPVPSETAPYYPWAAVREYYLSKLRNAE